jgi:C-terminal processing protease CtpA/Prc
VFHSGGHGSLAVKRLVPGGPAARCGLIKQGDILTYIDDTNVYQQSASDINHLISGPQGSFVRLRFKRSGSSPVVAVVERMWAPSTAERSKALSNGGGPPSKVCGNTAISLYHDYIVHYCTFI